MVFVHSMLHRACGSASGFRRAAALALLLILAGPLGAAESPQRADGKIVGMYVHQHWPYNHPYAARTWTLDDWRGYADGLKKLGFNTIMIWPIVETMPNPLTPSDRASLEKIARVIDLLHDRFGMQAWLTISPNVAANDEAGKSTFEQRHFFYCDRRVNPADEAALDTMMRRREELFRPLAKADALVIIDSDPGGYPGSTTAEFIHLLGEHRKMLDQLRPGIELYYWMHAGWPAYSRYYQTGVFRRSTPEEYVDALRQLKALNPEPWGVANGQEYAEKLGIASRVIMFSYGAIEGEPTFPMTNFGGDRAYAAGRAGAARGVMGNAQTHCVQLPNTFAFARGAGGQPLSESDVVRFADDLIPSHGALIVSAWKTLSGEDPAAMRDVMRRLQTVPAGSLQSGPLKGLLFGDPQRFVRDLVLQLRLKAAFRDFLAASEKNEDLRQPLGEFATAAAAWQRQTGYSNYWRTEGATPTHWRGMDLALHKLKSPEINEVLQPHPTTATGFESVQEHYRLRETYTVRLLDAIREYLRSPGRE